MMLDAHVVSTTDVVYCRMRHGDDNKEQISGNTDLEGDGSTLFECKADLEWPGKPTKISVGTANNHAGARIPTL
jgi:hypothetical protein